MNESSNPNNLNSLNNKDLPKIPEEPSNPVNFSENQEREKNSSQTVWIIVLAFAILACIGGLVWFIFSGRADQKIHGDNLAALTGRPEEQKNERESVDGIDPGVVVTDHNIDLTDYDSNITLTEPGDYTLSGLLDNSVLINAEGEVNLTLSGVTISASSTAAIANQTTNPLTILLSEGKTNTISDGGMSEYDGAIYSKGKLTIKNAGDADGKLVVSGKQDDGEGIATTDAEIVIESGKIMVSSNDDGVNCGGDNAGKMTINGGTLWIKAGGDGLDSNSSIEINDGLLYIMGSSTGGNAAIDSDDGYEINGGTVVALGSDMIESPLSSSKQKSLSLNLSKTVSEGKNIIIRAKATGSSRELDSVETDFRTLIYSASDLTAGEYEILVEGEVVGTGTVK